MLLTEIVRLEDLKLVDDCLWKVMGLPEPLLSRPFTRTTNSNDGILATLTRKLESSRGSTTPLISPEPIDSTRETSVTVAVSLPVKDTNKLTLAPGQKFEKSKHCGVNDTVSASGNPHSLVFCYLDWDEYREHLAPGRDPATPPQSQTGSRGDSDLQVENPVFTRERRSKHTVKIRPVFFLCSVSIPQRV